MCFGQAIRTRPYLHLANRQRFDFSPFTADQRHHGAIRAQILHRWASWCRRPLTLQPFSFGGLLCDIRGASGLGVSPNGGFLQLDAPEEGHFGNRLFERHLRPQPRHAFRQCGAQLTWQQLEFFIQGEKDRLRRSRTPRSCGPCPGVHVAAQAESFAAGGRAAPVDRHTPGSVAAR